MVNFKAKIIDPAGLHARPASVIVATASKFDSNIKMSANGKTADLKSIMNVMALGVKEGIEFEIFAEGFDADEAIVAITKAMKENELI